MKKQNKQLKRTWKLRRLQYIAMWINAHIRSDHEKQEIIPTHLEPLLAPICDVCGRTKKLTHLQIECLIEPKLNLKTQIRFCSKCAIKILQEHTNTKAYRSNSLAVKELAPWLRLLAFKKKMNTRTYAKG